MTLKESSLVWLAERGTLCCCASGACVKNIAVTQFPLQLTAGKQTQPRESNEISLLVNRQSIYFGEAIVYYSFDFENSYVLLVNNKV